MLTVYLTALGATVATLFTLLGGKLLPDGVRDLRAMASLTGRAPG